MQYFAKNDNFDSLLIMLGILAKIHYYYIFNILLKFLTDALNTRSNLTIMIQNIEDFLKQNKHILQIF